MKKTIIVRINQEIDNFKFPFNEVVTNLKKSARKKEFYALPSLFSYSNDPFIISIHEFGTVTLSVKKEFINIFTNKSITYLKNAAKTSFLQLEKQSKYPRGIHSMEIFLSKDIQNSYNTPYIQEEKFYKVN